VKAGASVPSYSGGLAACVVVSDPCTCFCTCKTPSHSTANPRSCGCLTFPHSASTPTACPTPCAEGASHTSPECNSGNTPGKTDLRSEGTPHRSPLRVAPRPCSASRMKPKSGVGVKGAGRGAPFAITWPNGAARTSGWPWPCPKSPVSSLLLAPRSRRRNNQRSQRT